MNIILLLLFTALFTFIIDVNIAGLGCECVYSFTGHALTGKVTPIFKYWKRIAILL
jgi:hypothetical protein